jgi:hypothetical protein
MLRQATRFEKLSIVSSWSQTNSQAATAPTLQLICQIQRVGNRGLFSCRLPAPNGVSLRKKGGPCNRLQLENSIYFYETTNFSPSASLLFLWCDTATSGANTLRLLIMSASGSTPGMTEDDRLRRDHKLMKRLNIVHQSQTVSFRMARESPDYLWEYLQAWWSGI